MIKHFNKKLLMTKEDDEDFENSIKCWICENDYVNGNVKIRECCHITGKYRSFAQRDFSSSVKLNHNILSYSTNKRIMTHILLCKNWKNSSLK